ncbi:MAG TPA: D-alanyl-D-alanine carboxypeptidase family protein [Nitriliruptorales bacterium]
MRPAAPVALALLVGVLFVGAPGLAQEPGVPRAWPPPPPVTAESYLLVDAATGQVLAEYGADLRRPVASTIKILTALTALRRAAPDELVTVGAEIDGIGGAGVGLRVGDRLTVAQLLEAVIARSGNDAAVALATHVGGSVDGFLALMRTEAAALGLDEPRIVTPSGLNDDNLLTARDLATITRAAMADPAFRAVAGAPTVTLPRVGTLASRNELLGTLPGATGVKTGFTSAAGYSVVGSAMREGRELIAVVLATPTSGARFQDAVALLEHGFNAFEPAAVDLDVRLRVAGGWVPTEAVVPPVLVPRTGPAVRVEIRVPIEPGGSGTVEVTWNGSPLTAATLVTPIESRGAAQPEDGAAVGRWLWDRAYAALRAGTADR